MFFLLNRIFKNLIKHVVEDNRCEVHQTILGIREGKEGWFEMFCLSGIACDDDGEMFSLMVCFINQSDNNNNKKPNALCFLHSFSLVN